MAGLKECGDPDFQVRCPMQGVAVSTSLVDKPLLAALMFQEVWRRLRRRLRTGPVHRLRFVGTGAARLTLVPPSLRHGDPLIAEAVYGSRFYFAGQLVEAGDGSIFQCPPPSAAFAAELNSFAWLRHHAAAGDALAARNARALVCDWIRISGHRLSGPAFEPEVAARRVIAWLSHADLLTSETDYRLLSALHEQPDRAGTLPALGRGGGARRPAAADGAHRARLRLALHADRQRPHPRRAENLAAELDRQVFPDGGHISRDPAAIVAILAELLPLRETYLGQGQPIPKGIYSAIDRMLPALRFFRHGDGSLALFNGAGVSDMQLMTALLRFDETLGEPLSHARHSGFHRLAASGTVVIADTGRPPPAQVSQGAHAGTLAFELSSGPCRIVVNCGRPVGEKPEWRRLSRATAAHSTVTLNDRSSSRFAASKGLDRFLGNPLVPGPTRIDLAEADGDPQPGGAGFTATHDGYDREFGLLHGRSLTLSRDGWTLQGRDRFSRTRRARHHEQAVAAAARFHLHPGVSVEMHGEGAARLTMRGQVWRFSADQPFTIEDSILFADSAGARRTLQLVVPFDPGLTEEIVWRFERER